jgi:S1-C subfamily serine protease
MSSFGSGPPPRSAALPLILAGAAFVVTAYLMYDRFAGGPPRHDAKPRDVEARGELAEFERVAIRINEENRASVVHVRSPGVRVTDGWFLREYPDGAGSGFVWDERGFIVTNYHVVAGRELATHQNPLGTTVYVRFAGERREYAAQVAGWDKPNDVAVLWVKDAPPLRPIPLGSSADLKVGQAAFAIGNPYEFESTFTTGVISALNRSVQTSRNTVIEGAIQTDAAINPGNSGGPLLDSAGRLIGMNTAIFTESGSSAGLGFAIPVDRLNQVVPELIRAGRANETVAEPAKLGVYLKALTSSDGRSWLMVDRAVPGSGADRAGIIGIRELPDGSTSLGDIVLSVDRQPVQDFEQLRRVLSRHRRGATVSVVVIRDAGTEAQREVELSVELS